MTQTHRLVERFLFAVGLTSTVSACPRPMQSPEIVASQVTERDASVLVTDTGPVTYFRHDAGVGYWYVTTSATAPRPIPPIFQNCSSESGIFCLSRENGCGPDNQRCYAPGVRGSGDFIGCPISPLRPEAVQTHELGDRIDPELDENLTTRERSYNPQACCYQWHATCAGGRAFRTINQQCRLALHKVRTDWLS